jgi:hypothetical protein
MLKDGIGMLRIAAELDNWFGHNKAIHLHAPNGGKQLNPKAPAEAMIGTPPRN